MAAYDIPFSAIVQPSGPTTQTIRNAVIAAGDDFTVTVTLYADEDANTPIPTLIGAWAQLNFFEVDRRRDIWDRGYGFGWGYGMWWAFGHLPQPILTVQNEPAANLSGGSVTFCMPPQKTAHWRGRYAFTVQFEGTNCGATVIRGILDVSPGIAFPARQVFSLPGVSQPGSALDGPDQLA